MTTMHRFLADEPPKRIYIGTPGVPPPVTSSQPHTIEVDADGQDECGPLTFIGEAKVITHTSPIPFSSRLSLDKLEVLEANGHVTDDSGREVLVRLRGESIDRWIIDAVERAVRKEWL